jgi:hypothetical protein
MKLTAKEISTKYKISVSTINMWFKNGILQRISNLKPFQYYETDIIEVINNKSKCYVCGKVVSKIDGGNKNGILCIECKNKCCICKITFNSKNKYLNTRFCISCKKDFERNNSRRRSMSDPQLWRIKSDECKNKTKIQVFQYYCGGDIKCAKCPYDDIRALSIDHINGDGKDHFDEKGRKLSGEKLYRWLKRNNFPIGFQILCMNCQFIKRYENKENSRYNII